MAFDMVVDELEIGALFIIKLNWLEDINRVVMNILLSKSY